MLISSLLSSFIETAIAHGNASFIEENSSRAIFRTYFLRKRNDFSQMSASLNFSESRAISRTYILRKQLFLLNICNIKISTSSLLSSFLGISVGPVETAISNAFLPVYDQCGRIEDITCEQEFNNVMCCIARNISLVYARVRCAHLNVVRDSLWCTANRDITW